MKLFLIIIIVLINSSLYALERDTIPNDRDNIVTTDMYISLLTETYIDSRKLEKYTAVVEKDVSSAYSKKILIPKGTRFVCSFEQLSYGETSLLDSVCFRIEFLNGKSITIADAKVYDAMGRIGMVGNLDKYGRLIPVITIPIKTRINVRLTEDLKLEPEKINNKKGK